MKYKTKYQPNFTLGGLARRCFARTDIYRVVNLDAKILLKDKYTHEEYIKAVHARKATLALIGQLKDGEFIPSLVKKTKLIEITGDPRNDSAVYIEPITLVEREDTAKKIEVPE